MIRWLPGLIINWFLVSADDTKTCLILLRNKKVPKWDSQYRNIVVFPQLAGLSNSCSQLIPF